jgi:hypothetical protein
MSSDHHRRLTNSLKLEFLFVLSVLSLILAVLFHRSFVPGQIVFSNDNPFGVLNAAWWSLPESFLGTWLDLNWLGFNQGAQVPSSYNVLRWIMGNLLFAKFYVPVAILFLGLSAWFFFRCAGLGLTARVAGAVAVSLNSTFFSAACWGVGTHEFCVGFNFLALAALVSHAQKPSWAKIMLAGLAVGFGVVEGADNGALFSLVVAAFVVYQALTAGGGAVVKKLTTGFGRTAVIALFAAFAATQVLSSLIGTQIKGVVGTEQTEAAKTERWDWATQWSFPKRETLGLVVPGLFGFRMDTPDGGNYWGAVGRDPTWDRYFAGEKQGPPPQAMMRFSGGGSYLGVSVMLIAVWAGIHALRRKDSVFALGEQQFLRFWIIVSVCALLLAFGRFAPFYKLLYALPYFSTIRNPVKFTAIFSWAVLIVFAFGIHGLWRRYVEQSRDTKSKLRTLTQEEKRWIVGCMAAIALSVVGWVVYSVSSSSLVEYLQTVQFDEITARKMATFSANQVGWFILFLTGGVAWMLAVMKGTFVGARAKWAGILLGLMLAIDLGRANLPWIIHWDYEKKYATNPILELLKEKPHEHRVAILPFRSPPEFALFEQLHRIEWAQHHFLYNNIQSLDVIQMPRVPADMAAFESALQFRGSPDTMHLLARRWTLTSTRYLLGPAGFLGVLNEQIDPDQRRFRIAQAFNLAPKPGISNPTKLEDLTAALAGDNGQYALFEFTGALPRAKLYSSWRVPAKDSATLTALSELSAESEELNSLRSMGTNDFLTLKTLGAREFDPSQTVLVADNFSLPTPVTAPDPDQGTAHYTSYSPKNIRLKTESKNAAILLLNDKYDPNWRVLVDGKESELLRCNFIMRGVYLPSGSHEVEFAFKPDIRTMYVTLASMATTILLCCIVIAGNVRSSKTTRSNNPRRAAE